MPKAASETVLASDYRSHWVYQEPKVENPQRITVAVLANGKNLGEIDVVQNNPSDLTRFSGWLPTSKEGGVRIGVFGMYGVGAHRDDLRIYFDLVASDNRHEVGLDYLRSEEFPISSVEGWDTFSQTFTVPPRPSFPGEPRLPRRKIKVTIKLVSKLRGQEPEEA